MTLNRDKQRLFQIVIAGQTGWKSALFCGWDMLSLSEQSAISALAIGNGPNCPPAAIVPPTAPVRTLLGKIMQTMAAGTYVLPTILPIPAGADLAEIQVVGSDWSLLYDGVPVRALFDTQVTELESRSEIDAASITLLTTADVYISYYSAPTGTNAP